jgi:homoserine O-acetyltransferase
MGDRHYHHYLIGPGKALDPSKHFIIAVDTFGNGHASSPSNSKRQPQIQFQ